MDVNHRFNVKRVPEGNNISCESSVQNVRNSFSEPVQTHATYPVASTDPKSHRNSLAQLTREALPRLDHYRNCIQAIKRPSLGELYGDASEVKVRRSFHVETKISKQRQQKEHKM
jgi:hypothetical protein